ncbi:UTP--glucose-1-phosphate uridylyltransferase GalU [Phaeovibrio sulfidiphilus]|uniref:UTP--glucose-1-phosphate uridylyltransferase n=1 Tax=Phaeovibrio sulfidiphilus TaxID=1220600 RepID=A0A8J6YYC0_9PROT|nr:UTP--glucose-1-phosphate uridylyltransferase GalU [Phaeovibrio sulfidiphilus]MBE1236788.1 UTP--glucose-1-phosphate uridylyltransferase GalU [Phaeovibrio sulfidiphilus]
MSRRVRKAVFPVAGMGTRFLPATKTMPKEMLPVVDKPLIQYAVEEASDAGIDHFIFITGRGKQPLLDHFDHMPELEALLKERGNVTILNSLLRAKPQPGTIYSTRQQQPLGLGHAVWCARAFIGDEPFAVLLPDDLVQASSPCIGQLMDVHRETGGNVVAVENVALEDTSKYGILDVVEDDGRLARAKGLVEKPASSDAPSTMAIIGRYVLEPGIFDALERVQRGSGGEIQLTDAMNHMIGTTPMHGLRYEGRRYDCGDKVGFLEANVSYALRRPEMRARVERMLEDILSGLRE